MPPRQNSETTNPSRPAMLLMGLGGSARAAFPTIDCMYQADGKPFPMRSVYADTEPGMISAADVKLDLGLTPDDVAALKADPGIFGPMAELMFENYPQFLQPESIRNGSRTIRLNTQLAVEVRLDRILETLHQAIRDLVRLGNVSQVLPVFFASTGGGAGSALVVLMGILFANRDFRALITNGLSPNLLDTPVAVVTEPFAYALKHRPKHAAKILANAFAFRIETALIESDNCFQYIFSQGLANDGGAVLDSEDEIAKALGTGVYQLLSNWPYIKARFVDTVDSGKHTDRFLGCDAPENRLAVEQPVYASRVRERKLRHRIRVHPNGKPR